MVYIVTKMMQIFIFLHLTLASRYIVILYAAVGYYRFLQQITLSVVSLLVLSKCAWQM